MAHFALRKPGWTVKLPFLFSLLSLSLHSREQWAPTKDLGWVAHTWVGQSVALTIFIPSRSKPFHLSLITYFSFDLDFAEIKLSRKLFFQTFYFSDLTEKLSSQANVQTLCTSGQISAQSSSLLYETYYNCDLNPFCSPTVFIYLFIIYLPSLICLFHKRRDSAWLFHHSPLCIEYFLDHSRGPINCWLTRWMAINRKGHIRYY